MKNFNKLFYCFNLKFHYLGYNHKFFNIYNLPSTNNITVQFLSRLLNLKNKKFTK